MTTIIISLPVATLQLPSFPKCTIWCTFLVTSLGRYALILHYSYFFSLAELDHLSIHGVCVWKGRIFSLSMLHKQVTFKMYHTQQQKDTNIFYVHIFRVITSLTQPWSLVQVYMCICSQVHGLIKGTTVCILHIASCDQNITLSGQKPLILCKQGCIQITQCGKHHSRPINSCHM